MGRRAESTEFLKECIADALFSLMETEDIGKITIDEITRAAGVGRMTYFRHFNTKEDVIGFKFAMLFQRWNAEHPDDPAHSIHDQGFFRFFESCKPYLEIVCRQRMLSAFLEAAVASRDFSSMPLEEQYDECVSVYAFFGLARIWAMNGFREDAEQLSRLFPL